MNIETWWTLTLQTGLALLAATCLDGALRNHVSARMRLWLYVPVLARLFLPTGWVSPVLPATVVMPQTVPAVAPVTGVGAATAVETMPPSIDYVVWIYLLVAVGLLLWTLGSQIRLGQHLRSAVDVSKQGGVMIKDHDHFGPLTFGLYQPFIVLPRHVEMSVRVREAVIAHELAHVRRGDAVLLQLLLGIRAIAWPILPVWFGVFRLRQLMEQAADELAAQKVGRLAVGEALVALDGLVQVRVAPAMVGTQLLKGRLEALGRVPIWGVGPQFAVTAIASVTILACCGDQASSVVPSTSPPAIAALSTVPSAANHQGEMVILYGRSALIDQPASKTAIVTTDPGIVSVRPLAGKLQLQGMNVGVTDLVIHDPDEEQTRVIGLRVVAEAKADRSRPLIRLGYGRGHVLQLDTVPELITITDPGVVSVKVLGNDGKQFLLGGENVGSTDVLVSYGDDIVDAWNIEIHSEE
jgi:beta-lactamase regulating signal transducer with metallopeptidase domain